jgi:hypothetical protein
VKFIMTKCTHHRAVDHRPDPHQIRDQFDRLHIRQFLSDHHHIDPVPCSGFQRLGGRIDMRHHDLIVLPQTGRKPRQVIMFPAGQQNTQHPLLLILPSSALLPAVPFWPSDLRGFSD